MAKKKKIKPNFPKDTRYVISRHDTTKVIISNGKPIKVTNYNRNFTLTNQDNKDRIVYTGGSGNCNTIRYPKKLRKNAWKKFYKLFPHLKYNMSYYAYENIKRQQMTAEQVLNKQEPR